MQERQLSLSLLFKKAVHNVVRRFSCFFLSHKSPSQISHLLLEPESSNFVYTLAMVKYVVSEETKMVRFFSFCQSLKYLGKFSSTK